jgi:hypothetical protein
MSRIQTEPPDNFLKTTITEDKSDFRAEASFGNSVIGKLEAKTYNRRLTAKA